MDGGSGQECFSRQVPPHDNMKSEKMRFPSDQYGGMAPFTLLECLAGLQNLAG